jgi:DNA-binding LacI/PurR family transcriptional regulator
MKALTPGRVSMAKTKKATIYDVAKDAGVSIATVSRVLNSPDRVSKEKRDKTLEAIDLLGFIPKEAARERARKELGRIGVITPFFTVLSFVQRLRGIAGAFVETQYDLTIYPVDTVSRLEGYYTTLPFAQRLDGIIVIALPISSEYAERMRQSQLPTIFIENRVPGFSSIEIDDRLGGRMAAEYLLKKGHTRCAYVGDAVLPEYSMRPEDKRFEEYKKTFLQHGLPFTDEYVKLTVFPPEEDTQIHELFEMDEPPTAIFAASDDLAMQVLKIARKKHHRIPDDMALIGFDNTDFSEYLDLTTIDQSLDDSGKLAAEQLIAQISDPSRPIQNNIVQLKIIERGTT